MNDKFITQIIIAVPNRLGDSVFCTPLFRLFKNIFPNSKIDVFSTTKLSAEILENNPNIHKIYPFSDKKIILGNNYDLVINVNDAPETIKIIQSIQANQIHRIPDSLVRKHSAEELLLFFAKKFNYDLTQFNKQYDLYPRKSNFEKIELLLKENEVNLNKKLLIGLHLGCHGLAKTRKRIFKPLSHPKAWPLKKFISLTKKFKKYNPNIKIILTGTHAEEKIGKLFCKKCPDAINLIDQLDILDLAALMNSLKLFIVNDTGPLHIACYSKINLIALFGKSDPIKTGPYPPADNRIVIYKPKIGHISVQEVFSAACNLI